MAMKTYKPRRTKVKLKPLATRKKAAAYRKKNKATLKKAAKVYQKKNKVELKKRAAKSAKIHHKQ